MASIDRSLADSLRQELLENTKPADKMTGRDLFKELAPEIFQGMQNGFSVPYLCKIIAKRIPVGEATLRGYIWGKNSILHDPAVRDDLRKRGLIDSKNKIIRKSNAKPPTTLRKSA
jgi:hypothetical protein